MSQVTGCGASYQSIYEGEVRFEHCYRLDEEASIPLTQRRECWREWTKFYTYGQTRDRLEYALRRQRELTAQVGHPGAVNMDSQTDSGVAPEEPLAAPAPTSPFVPPPHVHNDRQDGGDAGDNETVGPTKLIEMFRSDKHPPNQPCVLKCLTKWHECLDACDPKSQEACRKGCDTAFQSCGAACFSK